MANKNIIKIGYIVPFCENKDVSKMINREEIEILNNVFKKIKTEFIIISPHIYKNIDRAIEYIEKGRLGIIVINSSLKERIPLRLLNPLKIIFYDKIFLLSIYCQKTNEFLEFRFIDYFVSKMRTFEFNAERLEKELYCSNFYRESLEE